MSILVEVAIVVLDFWSLFFDFDGLAIGLIRLDFLVDIQVLLLLTTLIVTQFGLVFVLFLV